MSVTFSAQTVTYSESVTGWPSFYTFIPEKIVGMNGFLYTFKNPFYNFFPDLELILFSLFETLKDINLFIKDLF